MSNTQKNGTAETKKGPFAKLSVGLINSSIWKNTNDKGTFYTVTFERRYRDAEGNWKTAHSYNVDDLLPLAKAMDIVHTKIIELRNGEE